MTEYVKLRDIKNALFDIYEEIVNGHHESADAYISAKETARKAICAVDALERLTVSPLEKDGSGIVRVPNGRSVDIAMYNEVEEHDNCYVEIWRNTATGAYSVGWKARKE